ncbi:Oxidoreductase [Malassezia psittaci]|uniref:Mitochondrial intermembrane space import and assembly protein 40 n=1 Tax=Malassezia psittaci TaxID=1821823 RepID=A0AAF0F960_9BASI|nr:Oxidoreductase [Malassezia psittaci]
MSFFVRSRLGSAATLRRLALPVGAAVAVTALSVTQSPLLLEGQTKKYDYAERTKPRAAPVIKRRVIIEEVEVDEEETEDSAEASAGESSSDSESAATNTVTAYDPDSQESAFDERTGEINWDCPCLGGMAQGPCGEQFKKAFSCFIFSEQEPKGIECVDHFKDMQNCFREHPEVYAEEIEADNAAEADVAAAGEFAVAEAETA